jgi:hypothetical protein
MTAEEALVRFKAAQKKQQQAFRLMRAWRTDRSVERYRLANAETARAVRVMIEAHESEGKEIPA